MYGSNSITKFADDITVIGLISDNDESHYRAEVEHLATWCADNNLLLNTSKTKELIVDFRKVKRETHDDPIHINGMAVECVSSFRFLGIHISENLSLTANTSSLIKKAHQRLFFLRTLKKNHLSTAILGNFYRPPATTAIQTTLHRTGPSWTFLWVVSLLEGGPTSPFRAEPGRVPWAKTRPSHQALACEPQPQAWLQSVAQAYYTSRADLKRGIKKAKQAYKLKVEEYFVYSDPRRMWQGIQAITYYKPSNSTPDSHECVLPQRAE
ncbi:hypothetical protein L3Q82_001663 [Scortum barcoo]|uniref:Uncharacterized protein n=1 Tax=Scortum barcoo TaxID=214431 RepID=A0ACB8W5B1_9TELE|nr:hypothetical protein L3Q82_001663 [Scortum barcoo]